LAWRLGLDYTDRPMLRNTFCHLPGISAAAEERLWSAGLRSWDDALGDAQIPLGPLQRQRLAQRLTESCRRLEARDAGHFAGALPSKQHWRLFPEFRDRIAYVDIETTGLNPMSSYVTTIALYDGKRIRHYVRGDNLEQFGRDIDDYGLIVTYNGKCFDVPFLRASMGLRMDHAHIDLRYILRALGYSGGLKGCERKLGLDRGDLEDVDGFMAVLLWEDYRSGGHPRSLETLLAYNIQDVVNLETLLVLAYNLRIASTPFAQSHRLPMPAAPRIPFRPDRDTIRRIRGSTWWGAPRW